MPASDYNLQDDDFMPFGVHRGKKMKDVPPGYLDWVSTKPSFQTTQGAVWAYINRCRQAIDDDLDKRGDIPLRFVTGEKR